MMILDSILAAITSLGALASGLVLLLAFWRLQLLAPSRATRIGTGACILHLVIWLFYGGLWMVSMLPGELSMTFQRIYEVPQIFEVMWALGTLSIVTSLLSMAWIFYRGIDATAPSPDA